LKSKKILEFERLRFFGVLAIILGHLQYAYPWAFPETLGSRYAVHLFFAISGYLVSRTFLSSLKTEIPKSTAIKIFFIRRFLRLLPLAIVCIGYYLFIYYVVGYREHGFVSVPESTAAIATFRYNYVLANHPEVSSMSFFWTLIVEEHFYFFIPVVLLSLNTNKMRLLVIAFGFLVVRNILIPHTEDFASGEHLSRLLFYGSHARFGELFLGVTIYLVSTVYSRAWTQILRVPRFIPILLGWISLVGIWCLPYVDQYQWTQTPFDLSWVFCGMLVTLAAFNMNFLLNLRILNPALEYLGSRTYGLYIWHIPVVYSLDIFSFFSTSALEICAIVFPITVLVAEISYRFIERPAVSFGYRISDRLLGSAKES
jgi:peptidoglycan/LPS O-acetylase OafA/YrhL